MSSPSHPMNLVQEARRIVVKVGTSVLIDPGHSRVTEHGVQSVASAVAALWKGKKEVLLVTSGAIGAGMGVLGLTGRPTKLAKLQAAAAAGQGLLIQWYTNRFKEEGLHTAQILLTRGDLEERRRYQNAKATLLTLLAAGIVPIINENDTVSVEEIRYGDNDILSAQVATLIGAELLVVLSDVDRLVGLPDSVRVVTEVTPDLERSARGTTKALSTGGMRTKLEAAKICMAAGIPMVLVNGREPSHWMNLVLQAEDRGTWFLPAKGSGIKGRHRWLAFTGKPKGTLLVDSGAKEALVHGGRSLLASGIHAVEGHFRKGDLVGVFEGAQKEEFARGLVGYSSEELLAIHGKRSDEIQKVLGSSRKAHPAIHRDSLVILRG